MKKVENLKLTSDTKKGDCCPECNADWDGGDIYEHFLEAKFNPNHEQHGWYKDKTLAEIKESAAWCGWTEETPRRFGNLIGIDMSMDLNANEDEQYDGVSYWQCPKCQIAWHRFKGFRTDKFVKEVKMSVPDGMEFGVEYPIPEVEEEAVEEEVEEEIIYNAIKTPDGTVISSDHGHDYVVHEDKNGKTYGVDGGHNYLRRIGDCSDCEDLSMYLEPWTPEFHEKARKVVKRGGRGKNGDQPLTWVPICEMNDNWVKATIDYNIERGFTITGNWFTELLVNELEYREMNCIKIEE
jgi:hypothetical protein